MVHSSITYIKCVPVPYSTEHTKTLTFFFKHTLARARARDLLDGGQPCGGCICSRSRRGGLADGQDPFTNVLCGEYNALDADATRELMRREARVTVGAGVNVRLHLHGAASQSSNYRSNPGGRALDKHGAQAGNFATSPSAARHTAVEVIDVGGARQYTLAGLYFATILSHLVHDSPTRKA